MKRKLIFLLLLGLSFFIGWGAGYLRLPYFEPSRSMGLGFLLALALFLTLWAFMFLLNKDKALRNFLRAGADREVAKPRKQRVYLWMAVTGLTLIATITWIGVNAGQKGRLRTQLENTKADNEQLAEQIKALQNQGLDSVFGTIIARAEAELRADSTQQISQGTIERIVTLVNSLEPYRALNKDGVLSENAYSPERGRILLTLAAMKMDSLTFSKIKSRASFAYADLEGSNLSNLDLSGIDLDSANLNFTHIHHTDLSSANLHEAQLKGASVKNTNLNSSDLRSCQMQAINFEGCSMIAVNLNSANLHSGQLIKCDLRSALIKWADLSVTMFTNSNLESGFIYESELEMADFSDANLTDVDLRLSTMKNTNLSKAVLDHAEIMPDWFSKISSWSVEGADQIISNFEIVVDSTSVPGKRTNHLQKKG